MSVATKTNPQLWSRIVAQVKSESIGGTLANEWSARKAQIAVKRYKDHGGRYIGPKSPKNHLSRWSKEKWTTKSGRPSHISGERYLPSKAIRALTSKEYSAVSNSKRRAMMHGQQYSRMPRSIRAKVKKFLN